MATAVPAATAVSAAVPAAAAVPVAPAVPAAVHAAIVFNHTNAAAAVAYYMLL